MLKQWLFAALVAGGISATGADYSKELTEIKAGQRTEARASWWGFDKTNATQYLQAALDSGVKKLISERQTIPRFAVVSPELAGSMPPSVTRTTGTKKDKEALLLTCTKDGDSEKVTYYEQAADGSQIIQLAEDKGRSADWKDYVYTKKQ